MLSSWLVEFSSSSLRPTTNRISSSLNSFPPTHDDEPKNKFVKWLVQLIVFHSVRLVSFSRASRRSFYPLFLRKSKLELAKFHVIWKSNIGALSQSTIFRGSFSVLCQSANALKRISIWKGQQTRRAREIFPLKLLVNRWDVMFALRVNADFAVCSWLSVLMTHCCWVRLACTFCRREMAVVLSGISRGFWNKSHHLPPLPPLFPLSGKIKSRSFSMAHPYAAKKKPDSHETFRFKH